MPNEGTGTLNYEAEFYKTMEVNEKLVMDNHSLEMELESMKNTLTDAEKEIAYFKGQVEAFKFCVAKWGVDK